MVGAEEPGHGECILGEDLGQVLKQVAGIQAAVVVQVQLRDEAGHLVQQHNLLCTGNNIERTGTDSDKKFLYMILFP